MVRSRNKPKNIKKRGTARNANGDVTEFIQGIGNISLSAVYSVTDKMDTKIRKLNLPQLIQVLISATLGLIEADPLKDNAQYTVAEKAKIETFKRNFNTTVAYFMDFLDYDDDNQINLIEFQKGATDSQMQLGKDLSEFVKDVQKIGSSFKTSASPGEKVFDTLSKIFIFLTSDRFNETSEDVMNFSESVKVAYESLKDLKNIDHKKIFDTRVDDMISFIIMFCVVLIPVIDLVNKKLAVINAIEAKIDVQHMAIIDHTMMPPKPEDTNMITVINTTDPDTKADEKADGTRDEIITEGIEDINIQVPESIIITNQEIIEAINDTYGNNLQTLLDVVDRVTNQMIRVVKNTNWSKFCCCKKQ